MRSKEYLGTVFAFLAITWSSGKAVDFQPPVIGYFGCKFNEDICSNAEVCIDDELFGNCQSTRRSFDFYQYDLNMEVLEDLEKHLKRLIRQKYSWNNLYTQCLIGGTLFAFRENLDFNAKTCKQVLKIEADELIDEQVLKLLAEYVDEANSIPRDNLIDEYLNPTKITKKDEFVNVHKYFKPKKSRNEFSSYDISNNPDILNDPQNEGSQSNLGYLPESQEYLDLLRNLRPEDIELLQKYLFPPDKSENEEKPENLFLTSEDNSRQYQWEDDTGSDDDTQNQERGDYTEAAMSRIAQSPEDEANIVLNDGDTELLVQLLDREIDIDNLTDEEVHKISKYVSYLLSPANETGIVDKSGKISIDNDNEADQSPNQDVPSEQTPTKPATNDNQDQKGNIVVKMPPNSPVLRQDFATPDTADLTKEQSNDVLLKNSARAHSSGGVESNVAVAEKKADSSNIHMDDLSASNVVVENAQTTTTSKYQMVEKDYAYLKFSGSLRSPGSAVVNGLEKLLGLKPKSFTHVNTQNETVIFLVEPNNNIKKMNASLVASSAQKYGEDLSRIAGASLVSAGIGNKVQLEVLPKDGGPPKYFILTFVLCGCVAGILIAVVAIYLVRRHARTKEKLAHLSTSADPKEARQDYQDLCRQRMQLKAQEKPEPLHIASRIGSTSETVHSPRSSQGSTSSWSEEPVTTNMDISTGHIVLSYMEDHLKDRDRLDREWENLCSYEAEPSNTDIASQPSCLKKNRYTDVLPYDHSRVLLNPNVNASGSDYINANSIMDHDPRNPAYIATQAPLPHTVADFWQMVWEQGSVVIVMLTRLTENGMAMCQRYWPEEGSDLYHIYEVHLVSEHIWCDDFLVRSFYLKNLQTNETRTVTQFHFLTWPEGGIPSSAKAILDFRRKVNKSYRGRSCPVIVHCNDGVGRAGTYILLDMVLNRMYKGAKEIDIAASLEHIRDQRMSMVQTKDQFEFSLAAVAEEVHAILKALPQ